MTRALLIALAATLCAAAPATAATVSVAGDAIVYQGGPESETVLFTVLGGGEVAVFAPGGQAGPGCRVERTRDIVCAGVSRAEADLGDGDDRADIRKRPDPRSADLSRPTMPLTVRGGTGNDQLAGGDGDDLLDGGPGEDGFNGYGGDDTIVSADGMGDDSAWCGDGRDQAIMDALRGYAIQEAAQDCERVERHAGLAAGAAPAGPGPVTLVFDDRDGAVSSDLTITGVPGAVVVREAAGQAPLPGCETLDAQTIRCAGVARLEGDLGGGDDRLVWRGEGDVDSYLLAGAGNDTLLMGDGEDTIHGGAGDDTLIGNGGFDDLRANEGADTIAGGAGYDRIEGGDGADRLDLRDGGAMAKRRGEAALRWVGTFDEDADCDRADTVVGDPLDARRCDAPLTRRETDQPLPKAALPAIRRVTGPDVRSSRLRVALACPRTARGGCRGGVGVFRGARRTAVEGFDLRAGARGVVSLDPGEGRTVVVQGSDGAGRTRSVTRKVRAERG